MSAALQAACEQTTVSREAMAWCDRIVNAVIVAREAAIAKAAAQ